MFKKNWTYVIKTGSKLKKTGPLIKKIDFVTFI